MLAHPGRKFCFRLALTALVIAAAGCCQQPPFVSESNQPRSLVFAPRHVERWSRSYTERTGELPWFADRNDVLPSTSGGYQSATLDQTVTYTRDYQSQSGRRVYDNYTSTTYRSRAVESIR